MAQGPLRAGVREVEKLRAKCHYYCTWTPASVPAVSRPTEYRGIRVTPSTSLGPESVVVLSGAPGLAVNLLCPSLSYFIYFSEITDFIFLRSHLKVSLHSGY